MRLMKPSPGEAYDRMTILALKIKHSDRKEFKDEHQALIEYMQQNRYNVLTGLATELGQINSRLWDLEDKQRNLLRTNFSTTHLDLDTEEFLKNAVIIVNLNDARAETVKKINDACGVDSVEKLFKK